MAKPHPVRIRILDLLAARGPQTATTLATLSDESSGTMSYHLRQLSRHGLVIQSDHDARGRERWWEISASALALGGEQILESEPVRAAYQVVALERFRQRNAQLISFFTKDVFSEPRPWQESAFSMTEIAWLDENEFRLVSERIADLTRAVLDGHRSPGADKRAVALRFDGFPLRETGSNSGVQADEVGRAHVEES